MTAMAHEQQHEHHDQAHHADSAAPAEGEHGEGAAHQGHGDHGPGDINWFDFHKPGSTPYVANLINFAILLWIFWRFGKEPIARALSNRRETVKREIDEAQRIKKEAQARAKKYQKQLEHLDEEQAGAKKALIDAGAADKQRIVQEAEEKAARMERDAKALLESEIAQIKQDLTRETVGMAVAAAEELLRARITASDHERLAEDFLRDLATRNSKSKAIGGATPPSDPRGPAGAGGGSSRPPVPRMGSVAPRPASSAPPSVRAHSGTLPANAATIGDLPTGGSE